MFAHAASVGGVEVAEGVGAVFGAFGSSVVGFVAEGVGEAFHGESCFHREAREVQVAVDFDELHGPVVAGEGMTMP